MKVNPQKVCYELQLALHKLHRMDEEGNVLPFDANRPIDRALEQEPLCAVVHTIGDICAEQRARLEQGFHAKHIFANIFAVTLNAEEIVAISELDFVALLNRERVLSFTIEGAPVVRGKIGEGNPEAEAIFDEIEAKGAFVDPVNVWGPLSSIKDFDNVRLYGADLVKFHKTLCGGDIVKTMAVARAQQLNLFCPVDTATGRHLVKRALAEGWSKFGERALELVRERLPKFGLIEENRRAKEEETAREARLQDELDALLMNHPELFGGSVTFRCAEGDKDAVDMMLVQHDVITTAVVNSEGLKQEGERKFEELGIATLVFLHVPEPLFGKLKRYFRQREIDAMFETVNHVVAATAIEATRAERNGSDPSRVGLAMCEALKVGLHACTEAAGAEEDSDEIARRGSAAAKRAFHTELSARNRRDDTGTKN
jgi:hypothetical protein